MNPLSPDEIEEIEARNLSDRRSGINGVQIAHDIPRLLATIEKLRGQGIPDTLHAPR